MKSVDVQRSVTNSDGSFDSARSETESHESRDEDDSKSPRGEDLRDEGVVVATNCSVQNVDRHRLLQTTSTTGVGGQTVPDQNIIVDHPVRSATIASTTTADDPDHQLLPPSMTASFEAHLTPLKQHTKDDSFSFFGHSFDSVSHTTDLNDAFGSSPMPLQHERRHGIDISLPALSHSDASMADISPIKLEVDTSTNQPDLLEPFALQYAAAENHAANCNTNEQHTEHQWEQQQKQRPSTPPRPYGYEQDRCYTSNAYSNPFYVLRSCGEAFNQCSFLLSHTRNQNPLSVNFSGAGSFRHYQNQGNFDSEHYDSQDLVIASRRVMAAVRAFGGSNNSAPPVQRDRDAIFRGVNRWSHNYQSRFHKRYHMNGSRISWEVEEHPPIVPVDDRHGIQQSTRDVNDELQLSPEGSSSRDGTASSMTTPSPNSTGTSEPPKMKYRCKLCGQPKQNHSCPYRQSMQRSIGVSIYPAVNAYAANEPGSLAPPLSDMNNFVDTSSSVFPLSRLEVIDVDGSSANKVSPIPTNHGRSTPKSRSLPEVSPACSSDLDNVVATAASSEGRKRKHSDIALEETVGAPHQVSPFAETAPLRWEQYRAVSVTPKEGDFEYPPVPLSFLERKRLSDTLFALTKEIRHLTEEVASILHEAREREMWDLAVAEVLTQVVVALYCGEGDKRLDGLQHYLLAIGIAC